MTEFSKIEFERKLEEAKKEIEYYKRIAKQAGDLYLRETEALSKLLRWQKQAEEELRESKERFKFLAEKMADIVWTVNLDFQTTYVSPSIEKILGFTPEERKRQTLEEMITPESLKRVQMMFLEELRRDETGNA
ncbi:MAG: PAS domain-containing protein, partial [Desulfobacterales bacterium]